MLNPAMPRSLARAIGASLLTVALLGACSDSGTSSTAGSATPGDPAIIAVADSALLPFISEIGAASGRSVRYARTSDPAAVGADLIFGEFHRVLAMAGAESTRLLAVDPYVLVSKGPGMPAAGAELSLAAWQSALLAVAASRGSASFAIGNPARDVAVIAAGLGADQAGVSRALAWLADLLLSGVGRASPVPPLGLGDEAAAGLYRLSELPGLRDARVFPLPGSSAVVADGFALGAFTARGTGLMADLLRPGAMEAGLRGRRFLPMDTGLAGSRLLEGEDAWTDAARILFRQAETVPIVLLDSAGLEELGEATLVALERGGGDSELLAALRALLTPYQLTPDRETAYRSAE